jgi:hypothetical protein
LFNSILDAVVRIHTEIVQQLVEKEEIKEDSKYTAGG